MSFNRILSRLFRGIIYFPKTLYINFRTLPFMDAIKLPYIVMGPCSFHGVKRNNIKINGNIKTGMIRLAAQKTSKRGLQVNKKAFLIVDNGGSITFKGDTSIGAGTSICAHGGDIILGDKFSCNVNCFIYCQKNIEVGTDVLLGWNINIRDNDGHPIYQDKVLINPDRKIVVGNKVWIASYVDVLKGVSLADGTVVGTRSLVTKSFYKENILIAGVPAKAIKENISWEHDHTVEVEHI